MKPRFEEHEGKLFRMLDELVPAKEQFEFETTNETLCRMVEPEPKPLLADAKVGDLCKTDLNEWIQIDRAPEPPSPILYHFDRPFKGNIIHTEPLAPEGTAEWALQMWKLGNDIRNETGVVLMADYESEEIMVKHLVDVFSSGWQIYKEPKIEPPKEPDYVICKRCGGSKSVPNPDVSNTAYTTCPKCGGTGYEIKPEPAKEHESPVDPKERPLRNLIIQAKEEGKNIRSFYQNLIFTPNALTDLLANNKFRWWYIGNWELTDKEQNYYPQIKLDNSESEATKEPIADCDNCKHRCPKRYIDHCQMYEPKPTFKVGDWVEIMHENNIEVEHGVIEKVNNFCPKSPSYCIEGVWYDCFGLEILHPDITYNPGRIIRKLSPSEVIVKIGCLSGRVQPVSTNGIHIWFHLIGIDDKTIATIRISHLDAPTRELVEGLLEAQEEEK